MYYIQMGVYRNREPLTSENSLASLGRSIGGDPPFSQAQLVSIRSTCEDIAIVSSGWSCTSSTAPRYTPTPPSTRNVPTLPPYSCHAIPTRTLVADSVEPSLPLRPSHARSGWRMKLCWWSRDQPGTRPVWVDVMVCLIRR